MWPWANRLISFWSYLAPPIRFWRIWLRPWSAWGRMTVWKIWNQSHFLYIQGPRHCWACHDTHLFNKRCLFELLDAFPLVLSPDFKSSYKISEISRHKMLLIQEKNYSFWLACEDVHICVCMWGCAHAFCMYLWHHIFIIFNSLR